MEAETMTDDETDMTTCDGCEREISEDVYDANDGLCPACLAETFVCRGCEGRTHRTDAHATVKTRCEACGDALIEERRQERLDAAEERRQERLDAAAEAARELLEAIIDLEDVDVLRKAVAALKRIGPK